MTVRWRHVVPAVSAVMMLVLAAGCAKQNDASGTGDVVDVASSGDASTAAEESAEPSTSPTPNVLAEGFGTGTKPTPTRSKSRPRHVAAPPGEKKASTETELPPAPPKPAPPSCKPTYQGSTELSRSVVAGALTTAAGRQYWPSSAPSLRVPVNLVKAVAWQESGWQSNIIACDGGVGLMQVMEDTADFVNMRFEKSYDRNDPQGNATLGANYLAWLIKYFGDVYFGGDYTITTTGDCASARALCLVNAVISAYNMGYGNVDTTEHGLVIANVPYVTNVRALMTGCECLSF